MFSLRGFGLSGLATFCKDFFVLLGVLPARGGGGGGRGLPNKDLATRGFTFGGGGGRSPF